MKIVTIFTLGDWIIFGVAGVLGLLFILALLLERIIDGVRFLKRLFR